jgi:hypothetical protein
MLHSRVLSLIRNAQLIRIAIRRTTQRLKGINTLVAVPSGACEAREKGRWEGDKKASLHQRGFSLLTLSDENGQ